MSIQSEINRLTQAVSDTYSALNAKGATMPAAQTSANLAATAESIPQVSIPATTAILKGDGAGGVSEAEESDTQTMDASDSQTIELEETETEELTPVLYTAQALTDEQKEQARENIDALSVDDGNSIMTQILNIMALHLQVKAFDVSISAASDGYDSYGAVIGRCEQVHDEFFAISPSTAYSYAYSTRIKHVYEPSGDEPFPVWVFVDENGIGNFVIPSNVSSDVTLEIDVVRLRVLRSD